MKPTGICGSGIIDLLGELVKNNKIDEDGYLINGKAFKITNEIQVTQTDIKGGNGLMWSKAAISLGIKALLEEANLGTGELDRVYLAGSFGTYIDKENAKRIGFIPAIPSKKITQVGNAAALGAKEMLISEKRRRLAEDSADRVQHLHLKKIPNYGERLMLHEHKFKELILR